MFIPESAKYILDVLKNNEHSAYLVGGCVRDSLLGKEPKDYDIATSARPEEVKSLFDKVIPTGEKHGTVTVMIDKEPFEITTFRKDGNYSDGRRPDGVEFTKTIEEDLSRRDFTINAIAYDGEKYIDPYSGVNDLQKYKMIRCVGKPEERFTEDALRMLRCVRFSSRLSFEISPLTYHGLWFNSNLIENVSVERIREELCQILLTEKPSYGLGVMERTGLLDYIIPELVDCVGFDQRNPHHDKTVFEHILSVVDDSPMDLNVRLAALFHDIAKPQTFTVDENGKGHFYNHHIVGADVTEDIMKRLKFDNKTIEQVVKLVRYHMDRYAHLRTPKVKKFINRVGIENLDKLFELQIADIRGSKEPHDFSGVLKLKEDVEKVLDEKQPLSLKDLAISGRDLMEIGIQQGKDMGRILNELLEMVLEDEKLNTKEQLLSVVKEKSK